MYRKILVYTSVIIITMLMTFVLLVPASLWAGSWDNSPSNWDNSESNWENNPSNWKNNPNNWKNNLSNWNRENGIYDNNGESQGYITPKSGGGYNIYDDNGNRKGYIPAE